MKIGSPQRLKPDRFKADTYGLKGRTLQKLDRTLQKLSGLTVGFFL